MEKPPEGTAEFFEWQAEMEQQYAAKKEAIKRAALNAVKIRPGLLDS